MKKAQFLILAAMAAFMMACGGNEAAKAGDAEQTAEAGQTAATYAVNTGESELHWHGSKLAYGHSGVINITEGSLSVENGNITAGNFTVDMKTMKEVGAADEESGQKLVGHLMSPDFFDTEKFPTSKFEITGCSAAATDSTTHTIKGNLTIKDQTKNIEFPAKINIEGDHMSANASFTINRNDWGVTYGSGLSGAIGDKVISDNIDYKVSLKANKK